MNPPGETREAGTSAHAVLITGAARRLGREIALALARAGWDVVVHYQHSRDEAMATVADIQALGRRAAAVAADLADPVQAAGLFDEAHALLPLSALVNNASRFEADRPETVTAENLTAHLAPNLIAPVLLARRLFDALGPQRRGAVVNLLDQKLERLNPDFFSYTLAKHALWSATQMMAMAFAPRLRVNGVSPGLTLPSPLQSEQAFARAHRETALLDRSSTPADIAAAVVFLLSQPAITGVNLAVDGGQHLTGMARDVSFLAPGPASPAPAAGT